jgi:hypothetical protein
MTDYTAYAVIVFYGILTLISATIGKWINNECGFTYGYVIGMIGSLGLWFAIGRKIAHE